MTVKGHGNRSRYDVGDPRAMELIRGLVGRDGLASAAEATGLTKRSITRYLTETGRVPDGVRAQLVERGLL